MAAEIGEHVVLDDAEIVRLRQLQQAVRDRRRQRAAGRVLRRGVHQIQPRLVLARESGEAFQVGTIGPARHRQCNGAVRAQIGVEVEIAGIVDQHGIARLDQVAQRQVDRLRAAVGQQDAGRRRIDLQLREPRLQRLAQRQVAERMAVFQQLGMRRLRDARRARRKSASGSQLSGSQPQPGLSARSSGLERLARDPDRIDGAVELAAPVPAGWAARGAPVTVKPEPRRASMWPAATKRS